VTTDGITTSPTIDASRRTAVISAGCTTVVSGGAMAGVPAASAGSVVEVEVETVAAALVAESASLEAKKAPATTAAATRVAAPNQRQ
jgi:hypothetical protein